MNKQLWRSWLILLLLTLVSVPLCVQFVDRPIAEFASRTVVDTTFARVFSVFFEGLRVSVVLAFFFLLVCGMRLTAGATLSPTIRSLLVCVLAVMVAAAAEFILKQIFARSDPWPTYIRDGRYGFDYLHPHDGWRSFPSGTALGLFAVTGVLQIWQHTWRTWAMVASVIITLTIVLTNHHWLSDIIAGVWIGLTIGYAAASVSTLQP